MGYGAMVRTLVGTRGTGPGPVLARVYCCFGCFFTVLPVLALFWLFFTVLAVFGTVLLYLAQSGTVLLYLAQSGTVWPSLALFGHPWHCLAPSGPPWLPQPGLVLGGLYGLWICVHSVPGFVNCQKRRNIRK